LKAARARCAKDGVSLLAETIARGQILGSNAERRGGVAGPDVVMMLFMEGSIVSFNADVTATHSTE